ncbi:MAG: ATP-binding protein [Cyclobacteriaceae bacterium]|nr:ATP-binding protein [Cyclobacteriaceae bacterium]
MLATHPTSDLVKKVAIIGPECTGKTDLSQYLAGRFKTEWVPEYARAYLNKLNRPYDQSDLTKIAHGQLRVEDEWMQTAKGVLICDTNLIIIKVWSEEKFGICDPEILKAMQSRHYDLLLLTNIDIPWEEDPQREHPDKREYFWNIYKKEAVESKIPTVEISGSREERRKKATDAIERILVPS